MPRILERFSGRTASGVKRPVELPDLKGIWIFSGMAGILLWGAALWLWREGTLDELLLFHFDPSRVSLSPIVVVARGLSGYGLSAIAALYLLYLLVSSRLPRWDAPKTIYLYAIFSFGLSGIAGDLMKMGLGRPRPTAAFADRILALSEATSQAIPSGHATKALALALPFVILVSGRSVSHKVLKAALLFLVLGVGFSRIVLGAHYLSDVLAGFGTALVGFPFSMLAAHGILVRVDETELPGLAWKWGMALAGLTVVFMFV